MFFFPLALFVILISWGLFDNEIYPNEAGIYVAILAAAALCVWLLHLSAMIFAAVAALADIVLVIKLVGGDAQAF